MIKFIYVVLVVCFLGLMVNPAQAQTSRLYLSGYMGITNFNGYDFSDSVVSRSGAFNLDNTYNFAGALGLRLSQNLRTEAELSYISTDISDVSFDTAGSFDASGEIESYMGMLNAYYDFDINSKFKPFIGAGLGFGWHDAVITDVSGLASNAADSAYNLMWQVGGGVKYRVSPTTAFTGGYRYLDGSDLEIGSYEMDMGAHEFRIGFEYDLPIQ